jgi:hypothetical protein
VLSVLISCPKLKSREENTFLSYKRESPYNFVCSYNSLIVVFWVMTSYSRVDWGKSFVGKYCLYLQDLTIRKGRAIAQAVSRWLPTAAARVRARVWSSGICGGQNGAGAGFLRVFRFPLPIFIPPIAPQSPSSIIWGCTRGQKWPQYLVM